MNIFISMEVVSIPRRSFGVADLAAPELVVPTHDPAAQPCGLKTRRREKYLLNVVPWVSSRPRESSDSTSDSITTSDSTRPRQLTKGTLLFWRRFKTPIIPTSRLDVGSQGHADITATHVSPSGPVLANQPAALTNGTSPSAAPIGEIAI
jgi:hypothetical protein